MKRTIAIKLCTTKKESKALFALQEEFERACNLLVPIAVENRCWNRPALHHLTYYDLRSKTDLGSQMTCNAIRAVCNAFKALKIKKGEKVPLITFKKKKSVHFDKRTYSFKDGALSLYTLSGRIVIPMALGSLQENYLKQGIPKEAELVYRNKTWFFNLVLDLPDVELRQSKGELLGVDLGENFLAATSSGKLFSGKQLRHKCDSALALRSRVQSNGSKSSKQLLKKVSGKEARRIKHINHKISKAIIKEALSTGCDGIALENLTHIGKNIKKLGKQLKIRLSRWPWHQLQTFIVYKAQAVGLRVVFVSPAYTSKKCSECGEIGIRNRHQFTCNFCGIQRHSDLNASQNIRRIALSMGSATGTVNYPNVATLKKD